VRQHSAESWSIYPSIGERSIQARPTPHKQRRQGQLRKRLGDGLREQSVTHIKQGVTGLRKARVHGVPKFVKYVKIHLGMLVGWDATNITPEGNLLQE
jgi:hypothetical protein